MMHVAEQKKMLNSIMTGKRFPIDQTWNSGAAMALQHHSELKKERKDVMPV